MFKHQGPSNNFAPGVALALLGLDMDLLFLNLSIQFAFLSFELRQFGHIQLILVNGPSA